MRMDNTAGASERVKQCPAKVLAVDFATCCITLKRTRDAHSTSSQSIVIARRGISYGYRARVRHLGKGSRFQHRVPVPRQFQLGCSDRTDDAQGVFRELLSAEDPPDTA